MIANPDRVRRVRIRWHFMSPALRLLSQAGLVALLVGAGFALLSVGSLIPETAASVLVAVVFGVATVLQGRQAQRRQYTVGLLTNFQSTETLNVADVWMAERITARRPVESDVTFDGHRHVLAMLDYYEFLSSLALRGLVDTQLLMSQRGGTMTRCFTTCRDYIMNRRSEVGAELYGCFEIFVDEYARRLRRQEASRKPVAASRTGSGR